MTGNVAAPACEASRMNNTVKRVSIGWIAGFVATLTAHQIMIAILAQAGVIATTAWRMAPVPPLGVPSVVSLAFWGGVWGIAFAFLAPRFPRGRTFWLAALIFGALGPSLVAWFVAAPLKGQPMAAGFQPAAMLVSLVVNGAWGLATGWIVRVAKLD
jgi:hypothetical protein